MVTFTGLDGCVIEKQVGSEGGGGGNVEKNVLVMKCIKNVNIPYCGEHLSVNSG